MSVPRDRQTTKHTLHSFVIALAMSLGVHGMALAESRVIDRSLESKNFAQSRIGTDPLRKMAIYLPPGYDASTQRFPVIYFLANFTQNQRSIFDAHHARETFDRAIASGRIGEFIVVSVDMNTPMGSSWFVNSAATGNWEDFFIQEVVPYVDANFRTLATRDSRGITGDFMGGYGAIRFAMTHPDVFGTVYALHPVGSGSGLLTMYSRPHWDALAAAKTLDAAKQDAIMVAIFQAHIPNANKPPLYFDMPAHKEGERIVVDSSVTERLRRNFFLDSMVDRYADNLKSLRGFKFDWSRNDGNQDHVYANQALTHKLNEFGIPHEAEEYNGFGDATWSPDGRVYTEVLPFFARHLLFSTSGNAQLTSR